MFVGGANAAQTFGISPKSQVGPTFRGGIRITANSVGRIANFVCRIGGAIVIGCAPDAAFVIVANITGTGAAATGFIAVARTTAGKSFAGPVGRNAGQA
jgi:hypothetical protein